MSEIDVNEKMYHTNLSKADLEGAHIAIMPGDPFRVPKIAAHMQNSKPLAWNREYNSYLGEIAGQKVLACSHGIGGPSTAIAVEELHMIGIDTFVRIGTSGGMALDVCAGDIVVVNAAIRAEGTSKEYLPIEFPAVADLDVTIALREAARELTNGHYHVGVAQCKDSYFGQHDPARMPVSYELLNKWQAWLRGGAKCSEMESAAIFTVCSTLGCKAGVVMLACWNQEREAAGLPQDKDHDTDLAIRVALLGIQKLIEAE